MTDPIAAARRTICHYADDVAEARTLMCMLGIHPGQEAELTEVPTPMNTGRFGRIP